MRTVGISDRVGDNATFGQWKSIIHALGHAAESMQGIRQRSAARRSRRGKYATVFATANALTHPPSPRSHSHSLSSISFSLFGHLFVFDLRQL